jgi:transposase
MVVKYRVTLTPEEIFLLEGILGRGKHGAQKYKRAKVLLLANDRLADTAIAQAVGMHYRGVEDLRRRFVEEGFETTLNGKPRGHRERSIKGEDEARLIALAREKKPDGVKHWSLRVLRDRWATLENTDTKTVSHETIRQVLKKTTLNPGGKKNGASLQRPTRTS